jgi:hypothetical protein
LGFIPAQPLEHPIQLTVGEIRTIPFSYTAESLNLYYLASSNAAIAEIIDYSINPDKKICEIIVRANAASASSVNLSFTATSTGSVLNYEPQTVFLTAKVSKADEPLSVNPTTLALEIGDSDIATVSNDRNRTVTATSSDEGVAEVTYVAATKQLSVEAVGKGTATITLTAAETYTLNASECAIEVTVTEAAALLSVNPDALTIKAGESGTAEVSYGGDGALTISSSDQSVAKATYSPVAKRLSVEAIGEGVASITISAAATKDFNAAECTVEVTVTAAVSSDKDDPPPLGIATEYELVVGGDAWVVEYSEALQYQLSSQDVISVSPSNGNKTLTVTALAAGSAVLTIWAPETATTLALASVDIEFTVQEAPPTTKPVVELDPLSLPVGATATSTITLYDANDNPTSGTVDFSGFDEGIIEVSYDAASSEFSIHALAVGKTTLTISSDEAAEDYTMQVTVTKATDDPGDSDDTDDPDDSDDPDDPDDSDDPDDPVVTPTVQANDTGVKISGTLKGTNIPANATAVLSVKAVTSGDAYDKHLAVKGEGNILVIYEIGLSVNGKEIHDGFGNLTLSFPVDAGSEADTVVVRHLHQSGEFTEHKLKVANGVASLEVSDLSTFGVEAQSVTKPVSGTTTDPAKTGTAPAKTGDEAPLVMAGLAAVGAASAVALRVSRRRGSDEAPRRHRRISAR